MNREADADRSVDARPAPHEGESLCVLVVDDDPLLCKIVSLMLASLGVDHVERALDGAAALRCMDARPTQFDLVLCDLNMPGMDGVEFLRHLASRSASSAVVLLSGEDASVIKTAADLAEVHGLNVIGALVKPISRRALSDLLSQARSGAAPCTERADAVSAAELEQALENGEIEAYFQPKIRIATLELDGVETLARWVLPDGSLRGPGDFIELAEDNGLIDALTERVVASAMRWAGHWRREGSAIKVSINASVESLRDVGFAGFVAEAAARRGVPASGVIVEVTENRIMGDAAAALEILARLRLKGMGLSMDDYGTGYSSLKQLKRLPFTELKVDRSFVHGASADADGLAMLESTVALARRLGLALVAEGVEDETDFALVERLGVDVAQGDYLAGAMPGEAVLGWQAGFARTRPA